MNLKSKIFAIVCSAGLIAVACLIPRTPKAGNNPTSNPAETAPSEAGRYAVSRPWTSGSWVEAEFIVTAYCSCEECTCTGSPGITASGAKLSDVTILLAAPKRFAFGTVFKIPGYNSGRPVVVLDRGGSIRGNRLDVLVFDPELSDRQNHQAALKWGWQTLTVEIWRMK